MAITFVQSRASAVTTVDQSLAYNSNVTSGNLLLVLVRESSAQTADVVVTDTLSNTYTKVIETASAHVSLFWAKSASSGACTVSVNSDAATATRVSIHEYAGSFPADPVDQSTSNTTAATSPAAGPSINPPGAALVFAAMGCASDVTFTSAGTGFTLGVIAASRLASAYQIVTGTGAVNAEFSWTGTSNGGYQIAATFLENPGPSITVQPTAETLILTNDQTTTFACTATGTGTVDLTAEMETSVGGGVYATLANGSGITWTGLTASGTSSASLAPLTGTITAKTLTGRRVRIKAEDDNGTTYSNAVALTIYDGPQLTTFPATNGSGVSTATLTCDYVTGVGEAIEVRIPLSDGDVAVTVTTT